MKTKLITLLFITLFSSVYAQKLVVTSVANGNWNMPTTWDCGTCVPLPGNDVVINHHVTLNTDFGYTTGSVTINASGWLKKDASVRNFAVNGGTFTNHGTFKVDRFALYAGVIVNTDSILVTHTMLNSTSFTNSGVLYQIDSLLNDGTMNNTAAGRIISTHFWNSDTFTNGGTVNLTYFLNTGTTGNNGHITANYCTNTITLSNDSLIDITTDFLNMGRFNNNTTGRINITGDFLNADSSSHDAALYNNGYFGVGNNWMNVDTVKGSTGRFCIAHSTQNNGNMYGSFDFCDQTPPGSAPFIDLNTGFIGPGITYCTYPCSIGISEVNSSIPSVTVFPNPATNQISFELNNMSSSEIAVLYIYNSVGQKKEIKTFSNINVLTLATDRYPRGIYFFTLQQENKILSSGKFMIE